MKKKKKKFLTVTFEIDWDLVWEEMDDWENDNMVDNDQYRKKLANVIQSNMKVVSTKKNAH